MRLSVSDYARSAQRRMDPAIWDFIEGGAGDERTLASNTAAFDQVRMRPRVLSGVFEPDLQVKIHGRTWGMPLAVAPMAYQTMVHPDGELAIVRAAGRHALPVVVSMFAGRDLAELAAAARAPLWLQVYLLRDRSVVEGLVHLAERAGFEAIVLTVDTPHLGRRLRDLRNAFQLPPGIGPANLGGSGFQNPSLHALTEFEPTQDWSVVDFLRSITRLPILLKGIVTGADAMRAVAAGADGLIVSNHGGRQLDGVTAALEALPEVSAAVAGACPVLLDGGIRRGADVLAACASGADAVLLGRPALHGLAVGGEDGAAEVISLLAEELADAMTLTGTASIAAAGPDLLRPLRMPGPATGEAVRMADLHPGVADPILDTMNFLNEITSRYPDAISFAPGRPYDGFFDTEQIFRYLRRYLDHLAERGSTPAQIRDAVFQYGPASGRIRSLIADTLRQDEGIEVAPESIVVTVGCQEAMFLALRALFSHPDDVLLVSTPCYVGIIGAARLLDVTMVTVEERETGLSSLDVAAAIRAQTARGRRPRAIYVIPDHSNPSGVTMPLQARKQLLELAGEHDLLILEDSPYRLVSPGPQVPTLKSLDTSQRVIMLGSFSKTVFPGARVGYAVADQPVAGGGLLADQLAKIKSMITVNTPAMAQAAVAGALLMAGGRLTDLNRDTTAYYNRAMRTMLATLEQRFPAQVREHYGVRWNSPSGGFFLTLRVPFLVDNAALARSAEDFGVIWTPMSYFCPQGGGERVIRLSVSYVTDEDIREGVDRLARFIESEMENSDA